MPYPAPPPNAPQPDWWRYPPYYRDFEPDVAVTQDLSSVLELIRQTRRESEFHRREELAVMLEASLAEMRELQVGWDTYSAEPPNDRALQVAKELLGNFRSAGILPNRVVASVEGGVALCFVRADRYADIECFNSDEVLAVTYRGAGEPVVWAVTMDRAAVADTIERVRLHLNS